MGILVLWGDHGCEKANFMPYFDHPDFDWNYFPGAKYGLTVPGELENMI